MCLADSGSVDAVLADGWSENAFRLLLPCGSGSAQHLWLLPAPYPTLLQVGFTGLRRVGYMASLVVPSWDSVVTYLQDGRSWLTC